MTTLRNGSGLEVNPWEVPLLEENGFRNLTKEERSGFCRDPPQHKPVEEKIIIQCDVSSVNLCEQLGISMTTWKNSINKNKAELCAVIRHALVTHMSKYKPFSPQWGTNTAERLRTLLQRDVDVQINPVKSPGKPPRMSKDSGIPFREDPKSAERNKYLLTRTARLADQLSTLSRDVSGSSIFFFDDTLAKGHNLRRSPRLKWGGRLRSIPCEIKKEIETSIKKASVWACENIKADIKRWKSEDAFVDARDEYDAADECITGQLLNQEECLARRAQLSQLFRNKFMTGTIYPDANTIMFPLTADQIENENGIEDTTERTELFVAPKYQQSSLEFDEIRRAVTSFKDKAYITELECNKRLVRLGLIFSDKAYTGSLYPDADELMRDIKDFERQGDPVTKAIDEYEQVLKILDEAKSGRYPENAIPWLDPIKMHSSRCTWLRKLFKHKITTGSYVPDARILVNDIENLPEHAPDWMMELRETKRWNLYQQVDPKLFGLHRINKK